MKTTEQLTKQALRAVKAMTGTDYHEATASELRRVFIELAEEGAWDEYQGNGVFANDTDEVHVSELSDRWIAKRLIRDYAA